MAALDATEAGRGLSIDLSDNSSIEDWLSNIFSSRICRSDTFAADEDSGLFLSPISTLRLSVERSIEKSSEPMIFGLARIVSVLERRDVDMIVGDDVLRLESTLSTDVCRSNDACRSIDDFGLLIFGATASSIVSFWC